MSAQPHSAERQGVGSFGAAAGVSWRAGRYELTLRAIDIVVASVALILAAPILLVIAVLIRLDSPGPAFFWHERVGINRRRAAGRVDSRGPSAPDRRKQHRSGRPIHLLKFRTMYADARERFPELYTYQYSSEELQTLPIKVLVGTKLHDENAEGDFENAPPVDPRVTPMGARLRRSSLDELPNFWNVLIGDMHLVGPRPDIEENVAYYAPQHRIKLDVKPGITGLAQIEGRGMLTFHQINEYDAEYVAERCLNLDLTILLKTLVVGLTRKGAF